MYNLNYNVTYCKLNKPQGIPFRPSPRFDPFSGSIVLAVPGNVFTSGYVSVFNQTNPWDDISAYIKGSTFNVDTSKYETPFSGSIHTMTPTGSVGVITSSSIINNFSGSGYETSIYSSGYKCIQVSLDTGSKEGINLDYTKNYVIECWVGFEQTASLYNPSSSFGFPNKAMAIKEGQSPSGQPVPNATSSYWWMPGWGGKPESGINNYYSGSSAMGMYPFAFNDIGNDNNWAWGTSSYQWIPLEWHHYAVSYQTSGSNVNGTTRLYRDGGLIGERVIEGSEGVGYNEFVPTSSLGTNNAPLYILGSPFEIFPYDSVTSGLSQYDTGSAWYVQDFRMYNGTNKNYTGSIIPIPQSMIVGFQEPYPV